MSLTTQTPYDDQGRKTSTTNSVWLLLTSWLKKQMASWGARFLNKRNLTLGAAFLPLFATIHYAAYWLRFDHFTDVRWQQFACTLFVVLCTKSVIFAHYRIYQSWNQYATFYDLVTLTQAATLSAIIWAFADYLLLPSSQTARVVFFVDWAGTIAVVGGLRSLRRWADESLPNLPSSQRIRAIIVGAESDGEHVLRFLRGTKKLPHYVVGFVTAKPSAADYIGGIPIVGQIDDVVSIARQWNVEHLLIAAGGLSGKQVRRILDDCTPEMSVKVIPGYNQLINGQVDLQPTRVSIEDLLRRDPVQLDTEHIRQWLAGKCVMVTGSAGSIGSEICRQILPFSPQKLVVVDRSENGQFYLEQELRRNFTDASVEVCIGDITDRPRMEDLFRQYQPAVVFHAAAYKHVPLMESNCGEAVKNIPVATKSLADLADKYKVESFVMISTDKAVNPTSVMGCSKRIAELYVQALAAQSSTRFVTVRFGNVLGSNGSVVPIFTKQISSGGPLTVTHPDMQRYFMMIPEASQLVLQAGAMGNGGEIFVLDMGEPVKIVDLARDMILLSGLRVDEDIEIEFTGLRPGEKLFEELHIHGETHVATDHPKIMVAKSRPSSIEFIADSIKRLQFSTRHTNEELVEELRRIVPEFNTSLDDDSKGQRRAA